MSLHSSGLIFSIEYFSIEICFKTYMCIFNIMIFPQRYVCTYISTNKKIMTLILFLISKPTSALLPTLLSPSPSVPSSPPPAPHPSFPRLVRSLVSPRRAEQDGWLRGRRANTCLGRVTHEPRVSESASVRGAVAESYDIRRQIQMQRRDQT